MITPEQINRGGSKLEITRALLERGYGSPESGIPIPISAWKYAGEVMEPLIASFQRMRKPIIVRGSHPNDYHGYIDVVPTVPDVETVSRLEVAVREIEKVAASDEVRKHAEDWGQPFTPEVHILLQEQSPSPLYGGMMRHPHHPEKIFIEYTTRRSSHGREMVSVAEFHSSRLLHTHIPFLDFTLSHVSDTDMHELRDMYEALEQSGILDPAWAYQVEFGLCPLFFYQARPFKQFQPAQNFALPQPTSAPFLRPSLLGTVYGITPPEGIVVPFGHILPPPAGKYGFFLTSRLYDSLRLDVRSFGELEVFCSAAPEQFFHATYSPMKRANVSFIGYKVHNVETKKTNPFDTRQLINPEMLSDFEGDVRVFCNGTSGIIIPVKNL